MASSITNDWTPDRSESAPRPGVWLTDALLVATAVIWGVNYSVVKFGARYLTPLGFSALRVGLATVVLGALAWGVRREGPTRADAVKLVLLGVLGHGVYQIAFVEGLHRTTAGTAALILAASPAFIGIVGRLLGVEHPDRRAWTGIAFQLAGMVGVVLGTTAQHTNAATAAAGVGVVLLLAGAISWAFFSVLLKSFADRVHPFHLSAFTLAGGLVVLGALGVPSLVRLDYASVPPIAWWAVLYSGIGALVIAYLFYYRGVRVLGPVKTAMFSNLQPIIALIFAYFVAHELPTPLQFGGAGLIMAGLLVSRR
jgi:drug/metabolite transporter (DMT)-like permease